MIASSAGEARPPATREVGCLCAPHATHTCSANNGCAAAAAPRPRVTPGMSATFLPEALCPRDKLGCRALCRARPRWMRVRVAARANCLSPVSGEAHALTRPPRAAGAFGTPLWDACARTSCDRDDLHATPVRVVRWIAPRPHARRGLLACGAGGACPFSMREVGCSSHPRPSSVFLLWTAPRGRRAIAAASSKLRPAWRGGLPPHGPRSPLARGAGGSAPFRPKGGRVFKSSRA